LLNYNPHLLKCWFFEFLPTCFEGLVCWTVTNVFWTVCLLTYYRFLKCFLNSSPQILKCWFFELLPHMSWSVVC
jgi:hypothetical protein